MDTLKTTELLLNVLFDQFISEKQFITGCSTATLKGYRVAYRTYKRIIGNELPTKANLSLFIIEARKAGLSTISLNTYIAVFNSFSTWLAENGYREPLRIPLLKAEKKIQRSLTEDELKKVIQYKPKTWPQTRLHCILLTLMDTGCRIEELLTLPKANIDFDNMLIKVLGKGSKERIVPFSFELRKYLFKFVGSHNFKLAFPSRTGRRQNYNNIRLDYKYLCKKIGIQHCGFHAFRRTFAKQYVKNGGNVFYLQHSLGHTDIRTTKMYVEVDTEELQEMHLRTSLLTRLR